MPRAARLALAALALAAAACRGRAGPPIVLVSIDTLRADHVGGRRDGVALTPELDRFGRDAISFDDAIADASMTLPSHASMLTGLHPFHHRVLSNDDVLGDDVATVPGLLAARGYATGAVVSSFPLVSAKSGLRRGFGWYHERFDSSELNRKRQLVKTAAETTRVAADWLRGQGRDAFFLWVHYFPPHGPYAPPEEFLRGLAAGQPAKALKVSAQNYEAGAIPAYQKLDGETDPEAYRRRYAGYVRYVDQHVGALLGTLRELGLYETALIVVTSDHGESLGEHGWYFCHGNLVSQEQVRVPLLVKLPGLLRAGTRSALPVTLSDLAPTILAVAGVASAPPMDGRSLLSETLAGASARPRYTQSERAELIAVLKGPTKLVLRQPRVPSLIEPGVPERQLFDLGRDPGESTPMAAPPDEASARLEAELRRRYAGVEGRRSTLTPEQEEKLRALGYVR